MEDNKSLSMYFGLTVETEGEVCLAAGQVPRPGEDVGGLPHPGTARTNEEWRPEEEARQGTQENQKGDTTGF